MPSIDDPHMLELQMELSDFDPVIQRNLGMIKAAVGIEHLAYSMETDDTIAVSDASLGSR